MGGIKNKINNFIKKMNIVYFFVILIFIIMLAHIAASIFLFKKNKKNFNNFKNESEQAIKRIENKTDAIYSQVYRLRNQQFENYGK